MHCNFSYAVKARGASADAPACGASADASSCALSPYAKAFPVHRDCAQRIGKLYWCDREGMRANLDGSQIETLVQMGEGEDDRRDQTRWCVGGRDAMAVVLARARDPHASQSRAGALLTCRGTCEFNASGTGERCGPSPSQPHGTRVRSLRGWDRP